MPDTPDLSSVIDDAQRAAAAGDYASAERLLREAAQLQESTLGPLHPDLANTLNNLGVVCENTNHPAEAEICYRRACGIAKAVLEVDHPFVATSRKNLTDFCAARGIPVDPAPPPPPPVIVDAEKRSQSAEPLLELPPPVAAPAGAPVKSRRTLTVAVLSGIGIVLLALLARPLFKSSSANGSSSLNQVPTAPLTPSAETPRVQPPSSVESIPTPAPKEEPRNDPAGARAAAGQARTTTPTPASVNVVEAHLCTKLETSTRDATRDWRCDRPSGPVRSGSVFFYTRVKSTRHTMVEHRWYRDNELRKTVNLSLPANPTEGYRTFSRTTVGKGAWKVEIRTNDGLVLEQEDFVVR